MLDVLLDTIFDSLKIFPFFFIIYMVMEIIENAKSKEKIEGVLAGNCAPVFSALTGIIPECGFSVMCAKLYDNGLIKVGTLIAGFIASSDEGLIILISNGTPAKEILLLIAYKFSFAVLFGIILNILLPHFGKKHVCPLKDDCVECGEHHPKNIDKFFLHPLFHSLKTFVYFFIVCFAFGTMFYLIGEDNIMEFLKSSKFIQPFISSLIGLIPNCASSIVIAQAYIEGFLNFASLVSGLATNAGMGLLILFRNKKNLKYNIFIVIMLYIFGIIVGFFTFIFY